jgi:hypothetical protein
MYRELIEILAVELARRQGYSIRNSNTNNPKFQVYPTTAKVSLETIDGLLKEEGIKFKELEVYTIGRTSRSPSANILLLDELTDRLIVNLAKVNGQIIERIYLGNVIIQAYLIMVKTCLSAIDNFLSQRKLEFEDLKVSEICQIPTLSNQES